MTGYGELTAKSVKVLKHKMTLYRGVYGKVPSTHHTHHRFLGTYMHQNGLKSLKLLLKKPVFIVVQMVVQTF